MSLFGKRKEINKLTQKLEQTRHELNALMQQYEEEKIKHNRIIDEYKILKADIDLVDIKKAKDLKNKLEQLEKEMKKKKHCLKNTEENLIEINTEIEKAREELLIVKGIALTQECGLYDPIYSFKSAQSFKERLIEVRSKQKDLIIGGDACISDGGNIYIDNSESKGNRLTNNMMKLMLTSFNMQTEAIIDKIKDTNVRKSIEKIEKLCKSVNKSGEIIGIAISERYLELKLEEAKIKYEYELKRADEKEEAKVQAQILREQKELEKELEESKKKLEKERQHYLQQLEALKQEAYTEEQVDLVQAKIEEITSQIVNNDYRIANQRAGYLYIISNNSMEGTMFKIGVTRRLNPEERIDELGNASLPFKFNTHGIIFSEDAFKLESDLHKKFDDFRVNKVNKRKEFFDTSLEEIERALEELGYKIELDREVVNDEYLISRELEENV